MQIMGIQGYLNQVNSVAASDLEFNSAQLMLLLSGVGGVYQAVEESTSKIGEYALALAQTKNIKGNKWSQISDCLECFYGNTAVISINGAIQLLYQGVKDYYAQFLTFETAEDAVIKTSELDMLAYATEKDINKANKVGEEIGKILSRVSTLTTQRYTDSDIAEPLSKFKAYLEDVSQKTKAAEQSADATVAALSDLLVKVKAVMDTRGKQSITDFSKKEYLSSDSYGDLAKSFSTAIGQLDACVQSSQQNKADELVNDIADKWKKRQEEAARKKRRWGIITTVIGTAAAIAFPGVGAVIVGTIAGGVNGVIGSYEDQWADIGRAARGNYDVGSIVVDGFVGAGKGGLMGYVGGQFAGLSSGANLLGKIGYGVGNELISNVVDDGFDLIGSGLKVGVSHVAGDDELEKLHKKELSEKWDTVTDLRHWEEIGLKSTVTGTTGALIGEITDLIPVKFDSKVGSVVAETTVGSGKKILTKGTERITDSAIEAGVRGDNIWEGAKEGFGSITGEDILTWAVQGGVEAGIPSAYEKFGGSKFENNTKYTDARTKEPVGHFELESTGAHEYNENTGEYTTTDNKYKWVSDADKVEKGRIKGVVKGTTKTIKWRAAEKEEETKTKILDLKTFKLLDAIKK